MNGYNPDYIHLPATFEEALSLHADDLRKLMADAETSSYAMMLALPALEDWFGAEGQEREPELAA